MTKTAFKPLMLGALAAACLGGLARADGVDAEAAAPPPAEATTAPEAAALRPTGPAAPASEAATVPPAEDAATSPADVALLLPPELGDVAGPQLAFLLPPLPPPDTASRGSAPPRREALPDETEPLFDVHPKLKLEARLDAGDIAESPDGATYATGRDAYLKKVRFGVGGRLLAKGKYSLLVVAEHLGQDAKEPKVKLDRAYLDYAFADALAVRGGRAKLPLSRGSLLSSNDVFLRDPAVVDAIDKLFVDDTQLNLQLKGSVGSGVLSYAAAVAQGWRSGDAIHKTTGASSVDAAEPLLVARVELAAPGFAQPLEETRPGAGRRLSLGASYATQRGIRYAGGAGTEDRSLASIDLTARLGPFSAVAEADGSLVDSTLPAVGSKTPFGGYAQVAWFISGPNLEPAFRYEAFWDKAERGADQETMSLGLNWYPRPDRLKLALEVMRSEFGPRSADRLEAASVRTRVQLGADLSF